jgi:2-methylfumaryl-CoA hydratase
VGALRLRLVAVKDSSDMTLRDEAGKFLPHVLLDLDFWVLIPV